VRPSACPRLPIPFNIDARIAELTQQYLGA
jgi:hypothetical protein